jgi:hypothetical protein
MTLGISTVFVSVLETLEISSLAMNTGTALQFLFLGVGNVFCIPLTLSKSLLAFYLVYMISL